MQYHAGDAATVDAKPAFYRVSRDDLHLLYLFVTCSIAGLEKAWQRKRMPAEEKHSEAASVYGTAGASEETCGGGRGAPEIAALVPLNRSARSPSSHKPSSNLQ